MRMFLHYSTKFKCSVLILCALLFSINDASAVINITQGLPDTLRKCQGDALNLSVSATSDSALSYVWKRDGTAIGTNSPVFSLTSMNIPDGGEYTLEIKELNTPNAVTLTCFVSVNMKPSFVTQPNGTSPLCEYSKLTILADADHAKSVLWTLNGVNTSVVMDTFIKDSITVADTGWYQLNVTALPGCRDTMSSKFYLDVRKRLTITSQPLSAGLRTNSSLSYVLRVGTSGTGPFAYQWYKDDLPISGQVSDSFKVLNFITAVDSGKYYVVITSSNPCLDTVRTVDAYLYPTLCPIIVSISFNGKVMGPKDTLFYACKNGPLNIELKSVGAKGFQWTRNGFPINGAIYTRYTISDMREISNGCYSVELISDTGLTCSLIATPPICVQVKPRQEFTVQPMSNEKCDATTHTMVVAATNTDSYQWLKDGVAIPGAINNTHIVNSVDLNIQRYTAHAINSYCPPFPSKTVFVRQIIPSDMATVNDTSNFNLSEQCTDNNGWTYFSDNSTEDGAYKMLFAIRKNGNLVHFRPDIKTSLNTIHQISADNVERKGILMGRRRMFTIKVDSGEQVTNPYDVKFYYSNIEKNEFLNEIYRIRSTDFNNFSTRWSTDNPSFITSTQEYMDDSVVRRSTKFPLQFNNSIASDVKYGVENLQSYAEINRLIATRGGGTFYFDYNTFSTVGISSADKNIQFSIYPNPATSAVNVNYISNNKKDITMTIFNQVGQIVGTEVLNGKKSNAKLDVSHLSNGTYIVRLEDATGSIQSRLTINK